MDPLRISGILMTTLVHGTVVAGLVAFSDCRHGEDDDGPRLTEMTTIEAALAYKAKEPETRQPQKRQRQPKPVAEPQTISRDEQQAPVEPDEKEDKPEPQETEEDFAKEFEKYKNQRQSSEDEADLPTGDQEAPQQGGSFDGSEHGFAEISKGDPYMQQIAADVYQSWTVPTLETGTGQAVGCVRLGTDGRIIDTKLWQSSKNSNIDRSVELALDKLKELRKEGNKPVPQHLMEATTQWTCFKFSV